MSLAGAGAVLALWLGLSSALAQTTCTAAIGAARHTASIPPRLLQAIAFVESGRFVGGLVVPWPWTVNVQGNGYFFETRADAVNFVLAMQAKGVRSIDVGCMQVNLMHHPDAFSTLDQAFDPAENVAYAVRFLLSLYAEQRSWPVAASLYHSRTPEFASQYSQRLAAVWPEAARAVSPGRSPGRSETARIDPYGVYTPEFARQMAQDAAFQARRDSHLKAGSLVRRAELGDAGARLAAIGHLNDHGPGWAQAIGRRDTARRPQWLSAGR